MSTILLIILFLFETKDGKNHVTKDIVEAIERENKTVTFKVIEGDILKEYKSFKAIVQAISKGEATWVRWIIEYEKLNKKSLLLLNCLDL